MLHKQQKHIEALRAESKAKDTRYEEDIEEYEIKLLEWKAWGIVSPIILLFALGWVSMVSSNYSEDLSFMRSEKRSQDDLQQRFDNVVEDWHYQSNRATELQQANEALIEHCHDIQ